MYEGVRVHPDNDTRSNVKDLARVIKTQLLHSLVKQTLQPGYDRVRSAGTNDTNIYGRWPSLLLTILMSLIVVILLTNRFILTTAGPSVKTFQLIISSDLSYPLIKLILFKQDCFLTVPIQRILIIEIVLIPK